MSWEPPFGLGPGSAELPEGRRFLRMLQRNIRYLIGGSAVAIVALFFLATGNPSGGVPVEQHFPAIDDSASPFTPDEGSGYPSEQVGATYAPELGEPAGGTPSPAPPPAGVHIYAVSLAELPGLPPDAAPGTELDLWVTWEPPITRHPKVQLLARGVTLEGISPPLTIDGPYVANLLVTMKDLPDLLYGDRFGELNASLPPN